MLLDIISDYHKATKRDYLGRMTAEKPECMAIARQFGKEFFDGERKYGYGGYKYDGRWVPIAKRLIQHYNLNRNSMVLDIGCGKGYLLYEIERLIGCKVFGCDVSGYALSDSPIFAKRTFEIGKDTEKLIYDGKFDLVLCINVLHNLTLPGLKTAFQTLRECAEKSYIVVDSYRNEQELHNLQCWALTAECFFRPEEWEFLFKEFGYLGDWEYIFYE